LEVGFQKMSGQRPYFFHYALGYRQNPFAALTTAEWTAVAFVPLAVAQVVADGGHVQLLGPKGVGKTSVLLKLGQQLAEVGQRVVYEYVPEGQRRFFSQSAGLDVWLLDEVQRFSWHWRRRWAQQVRANGLRCIFSAHEDMTGYLRGDERPLHTLHLDQLKQPADYEQWIARRLAYFALPGQERVQLTAAAVGWLWQTFGPDMRAAEYFLYELFQQEGLPLWVDVGELNAGHSGLSGHSEESSTRNLPH
jgi:hypothetical protein